MRINKAFEDHLQINEKFRQGIPEWSTKVDRWHQLDNEAMALCESYWKHRKHLCLTSSQSMILNSPRTSNRTDHLFQQQFLPFLFVHTLPNVKISALGQLAGWSGEFFSLITEESDFLNQAQSLISAQEQTKHQWLLCQLTSTMTGLETIVVTWYVVDETSPV